MVDTTGNQHYGLYSKVSLNSGGASDIFLVDVVLHNWAVEQFMGTFLSFPLLYTSREG